DVDAAAEGAEHEIVLALLDRDFADRNRGNARDLAPVLAAVLAPVRGELGAGEEQTRIHVILRDRIGRAARRRIAGNGFPGPSRVGALEQVRREVAVLMVLDGRVN